MSIISQVTRATLRLLKKNFTRMSSSSNHSNVQSNPLRALMEDNVSPRLLLSHLAPSFPLPSDADDVMLWRLILQMIGEPPKRKKLPHYNTIEDAIELIRNSNKIVVLSGAGISTSAGLPDFRSRNGIYVQIHAEHPDLDDPKSMFDIEYFKRNPRPFYQFAKALYPGQFKPTIGHQFIKCIEDHNKLLRNYTQNIDTLEKQADISKLIECHGSFAKATCTNCKYCVDGDAIRADVFAQRVPKCPKCHRPGESPPDDGLGILKPNIVFFGEQLGDNFHTSLESDKNVADLLIIIGSSLKVRPVALIPRTIESSCPQILINKEPLENMDFDVELLGDCEHIIQELCLRLGDGWSKICQPKTSPLKQLVGAECIQLKLAPVGKDEPTSEENKEAIEEEKETTSERKSNHDDHEDDDDDDDDDDWEDIEVLDDDVSGEKSRHEKVDVEIPENSFVLLKPNRYVFQGAELSMALLEKYSENS